jgi:membrane protease YdiL (CAAX protease family)
MEGQPSAPPRRVSYWEIFFVVGSYTIPLTLESLFGAKHPGQTPTKPEYVDWFLVIHASRSVTMLGLLYIFLQRGGESLRDFTEPSRRLGDIGWGIGLTVLGYLVAWPAYYLGLAMHLEGMSDQHYQENLDFLRGHVSLAFVAMIIANPFAEEAFMRAYLQTRLRQKGWGAVATVAGSVLLQTGYHLYQGIPSCVSLAAIFLIFALYYHRTRRLWPVVIAHLIMDALAMAQFSR